MIPVDDLRPGERIHVRVPCQHASRCCVNAHDAAAVFVDVLSVEDAVTKHLHLEPGDPRRVALLDDVSNTRVAILDFGRRPGIPGEMMAMVGVRSDGSLAGYDGQEIEIIASLGVPNAAMNS